MANKILVVDDEPDLQLLITQKFRSSIAKGELIFDFALNGEIALEKATADPEIDLIFTDINMPVMDGLTLLNNLKERKVAAKAIVISAYSEIANIRVAMNKGAFDFITKPIELADLEVTMHKGLREMEMLRQGIETKQNLERTTHEKEEAILEKIEAQRQALENLQEKEKLILQQNEMLENQVRERTSEVVLQKELIEQKNKEILDSIRYAKRLQEAILPPVKIMNGLFPHSLIYYCAKDIVAGDFYWFDAGRGQSIVVAADCTGHGVAGALMSMIGISLLNQLVNEKGITNPATILQQLHVMVIAALKQDENNTNDGMDICICAFDQASRKLKFAGANRPLWLLRNNEMIEYPPNKFPIGGLQVQHDEVIIQHDITLEENDMLYLFTDGYADQFGGENGKKLMKKNFREMLLSMQHMNMKQQEIHLKQHFENWKGMHDQVDDVLVIGIKIQADHT